MSTINEEITRLQGVKSKYSAMVSSIVIPWDTMFAEIHNSEIAMSKDKNSDRVLEILKSMLDEGCEWSSQCTKGLVKELDEISFDLIESKNWAAAVAYFTFEDLLMIITDHVSIPNTLIKDAE